MSRLLSRAALRKVHVSARPVPLADVLGQSTAGRNDWFLIDLANLDTWSYYAFITLFSVSRCWGLFVSGASLTLKVTDLGINMTFCDVSEGLPVEKKL